MKYYSTWTINERMRAEKPFSDFVGESIDRFLRGDFGTISEADKQQNQETPDFQVGAYIFQELVKIWIIKENGYVMVLFPNEY